MSKVINMFTKNELEKLPFDEATALGVMKHILNFKAEDYTKITMQERVIIDAILKYVANASGADPNEMFTKALTEIDSLVEEAYEDFQSVNES